MHLPTIFSLQMLVEKGKECSNTAFGSISVETYEHFYTENKGRLMAYLMRLTGDAQLSLDLMQESFTRYLAGYGRNGGSRTLLFTIARNAALDALRRHREEPSADCEREASGLDPECRCIAKEAVNRMVAAIRRLDPLDRELISLVATEAFSYKSIGKLLDISEGNVKIRVHRARLRLRSILADGDK